MEAWVGARLGRWLGTLGLKSLPVRWRARLLRPFRGEVLGALGSVISGGEWFVMHSMKPRPHVLGHNEWLCFCLSWDWTRPWEAVAGPLLALST